MTASPLLLRLARTRIPDLMLGHDRVWRGACPCCARFSHQAAFCVYPSFYHCTDCGLHGDAVDLLMNDDGMSRTEAQDFIGRMERRA